MSGATSHTSAGADASVIGMEPDVLVCVDGARSDEAQQRSASACAVALGVAEPSVPDCIGH